MITAVRVYQGSKSYILNRFRQVHPFGVCRPGTGALPRAQRPDGKLNFSRSFSWSIRWM